MTSADALHLFQSPQKIKTTDPLVGLIVTLPTACKCGAVNTITGPGVGPHRASLHCVDCRAYRQWLGRRTCAFLIETINKFGRPTAPIAIRQVEKSVGFIHVGKLAAKSAATTDDRAPPAAADVVLEADKRSEDDVPW